MTRHEESKSEREGLGKSVQWIFYFMAIASLFGMLFIAHKNAEQDECQREYAEANYVATRARSRAAEQRQIAFDTFIANFLNVKTPAESRKLIEDYVKARNLEVEERAKNPLPEPPSKFCR